MFNIIYCNSAFEISCFIEKFCLAFFRGGEGIKKEMIRFVILTVSKWKTSLHWKVIFQISVSLSNYNMTLDEFIVA